jgi:hypothetical protein
LGARSFEREKASVVSLSERGEDYCWGEGVWYIYHPRHPQNGQVRQTPEPPRQDTEVPRRPEQIRIQLNWLFVARII